MKELMLIILNSIKNNLKSKILVVVFIIVVLLIIVLLVLFFCLLLITPEINKHAPDINKLELYLSLILYSTSIICLGINMNIFAFQSIIKEKSHGNIESLLATPLNVKSIWVAKSLAVFIPGMVLGEILTFAALLTVNYIYFVPRIGFIYTHWIGLSSFLAVPLIYLCLSLLSHLIGLSGKPANGNIIAQVFLPVILSLMINLSMHNILDASSWSFTFANLGLAAFIAIIVMLLQPRITKERIILSK